MVTRTERVLILCKTYPSPSGKYAETSCVAGLTENGQLIRLYPVPFRLIADEQKFRKWQWLTAMVEKTRDTLELEGSPLEAGDKGWPRRRESLGKVPQFTDFDALEQARRVAGQTKRYHHKVVDWEAGALFRKLRKQYGPTDWETPFRQKYETEFSGKPLISMLGTVHRFPDQWLIVSVFAPPKPRAEAANQGTLF
jgi:hypothetical protein